MAVNVWDPLFSDNKQHAGEGFILPLVLASRHAAPAESFQPLSVFRMHKAVYLLQQEGPPSWDDFTFHPHTWGPFSADLDRALRFLVDQDRLESQPDPLIAGYRTTAAGDRIAWSFWRQLSDREQELVRGIRSVASSAFVRA